MRSIIIGLMLCVSVGVSAQVDNMPHPYSVPIVWTDNMPDVSPKIPCRDNMPNVGTQNSTNQLYIPVSKKMLNEIPVWYPDTGRIIAFSHITNIRNKFDSTTYYRLKCDTLMHRNYMLSKQIVELKRYINIVVKNPSQLKYLKGWFNRATSKK